MSDRVEGVLRALVDQLAIAFGAPEGTTAVAADQPIPDGPHWVATLTSSAEAGDVTLALAAGDAARTARLVGQATEVSDATISDFLEDAISRALTALAEKSPTASRFALALTTVESRPTGSLGSVGQTFNVTCAEFPMPISIGVAWTETRRPESPDPSAAASAEPAEPGPTERFNLTAASAESSVKSPGESPEPRMSSPGESAESSVRSSAARAERSVKSSGESAEPSHGAKTEPSAEGRLDVILDIDLPVVVRFGRADLSIRAITRLGPGSLVELGRSPDEPVEVLVSDRVVARGEVVVVGGNYGIRILDIVKPSDRLRSMEA